MFNIVLMGLVSLLTDVSSEMAYPLLPLYLTTSLGASPSIIGLIEGLAESLASMLKVFSGAISDRFGQRKPLAVIGYSLSILGKGFFVFAGSWAGVLVGRLVDRFGKGIRTAPRDALIADSAPENRRGAAFGLHRAMDTMGATIGVVLAYYFLINGSGDYRQVFIIAVVPATLGMLCLLLVQEKKERQGKGIARFSEWKALDPRLRSFLVITVIFPWATPPTSSFC